MKEMTSLLLAAGASSILVGAAAIPLLMSGPVRTAVFLPQPASAPSVVAPALASTPREAPTSVPVQSGPGATHLIAYWDAPDVTPVVTPALSRDVPGGLTAICLCGPDHPTRPVVMN